MEPCRIDGGACWPCETVKWTYFCIIHVHIHDKAKKSKTGKMMVDENDYFISPKCRSSNSKGLDIT